MVQKGRKTGGNQGRVYVNTLILVLTGVLFGALTVGAVKYIEMNAGNYKYLIGSDMPQICFEEESFDSSESEGAYVCSTEYDDNGNGKRLTSNEDLTMFLQNQLIFSSTLRSLDLKTGVATIGTMMAILCLVSGLVYWNHNRE